MTEPTYVLYPAFSVSRTLERADPETLLQETENLFKEWSDRIEVRGHYTTVGFDARSDYMSWWIARSFEDIQDFLIAFRRSAFGRLLEQTHAFLGVHRPPETAPDHLPSFLKGEPPKRFACVYPFVRTPEWYLQPKEDRARLLREHGEIGREFPGILPNTTSAFGLGDWEWILAFEADDLTELVDCIRRLRDSESRLYVKVETPFLTGTRKELAEVVRDVV
jgi:chlorite dismutase